MKPAIYLFPSLLSPSTRPSDVLPLLNISLISEIKFFVVENIRSARRFLKAVNPQIDIDSLTFVELSEHTPFDAVESMLAPVAEGQPVGVISEAGCPAVADPGADLVALAQRKNIPVVPLVGPSSIILALMASGLNGQDFAFRGYLPVESHARIAALRSLERESAASGRTFIFIETPYRNNRLIADILRTLSPATTLCIASNITDPEASILTKSVGQWRKINPQYPKTPTIFLINARP